MLPISIASGTFFHPDSRLPLILARLTRGIIGLIILVSLFITIILFSKRDHFGGSDTPAVIAEYLRPRLKPGDVIYAANHFHILYYLLEKECPTPYVHPTLLITPSHREALNLDLDKELQRIIGKKPAYILIQMKGKNKVDWLFPFLNENYVFEKQFAGKMSLYRHKDKTPIPIP